MRAEPIRVMTNNHTHAVTIRDLVVPAENRIVEEGRGFRYLLDGLNAERILMEYGNDSRQNGPFDLNV